MRRKEWEREGREGGRKEVCKDDFFIIIIILFFFRLLCCVLEYCLVTFYHIRCP